MMLARDAEEPGFTVLATTPCAVSTQVTPSQGGECLLLARCQKFTTPAAIKSAAALSSSQVRPVIIEPFILSARVEHFRYFASSRLRTRKLPISKQPMFQPSQAQD